MPLISKITDPNKIVTDKLVLKELTKQGIDKDYVEFTQDYAPRWKGKGRSPYAKFYRDLKSGKHIAVVSGLPRVKEDGTKIELGWLYADGKYYSKPNLFSAVIENRRITFTMLEGKQKGKSATWLPQLYLDDVEQNCGNATISDNILEWDYGICKRRIRLIRGNLFERWVFSSNPKGKVRIKHNLTGEFPIRLGTIEHQSPEPLTVSVVGDEEIVKASEFDKATFPVEVGASPETVLASADTGLWESQPTDNLSTQWNYVGGQTAKAFRSIFKFDLSGIDSGATVTDAVLSLWEAYALGATADVTLNRILLNWVNAEATWNIYSTGNNWNTAGAGGADSDIDSDVSATLSMDGTAAVDWVAFEGATLIDDVQKFIDGTYANNYGWRLAKLANEGLAGNNWNRFDSIEQGTHDPKLVVTYTPPVEGTATLSGVGTLAGIGSLIAIGKATLSGTGTLASIGRLIAIGKATLSGTGTLAGIGSLIAIGKATLSGVGTLAGIGVITAIGKATLSGIGTLVANAMGSVISPDHLTLQMHSTSLTLQEHTTSLTLRSG